MKLSINKKVVLRIVKLLKWGKIATKFAAIGTTISGALTALSGSATSGIAISAAGATTYAAAKGIQNPGYEKTKHIPPGRVDKAANMLRKLQMDASKKTCGVSRNSGQSSGVLQQGATVKQPTAVRAASQLSGGAHHIVARKK